MRRILITGGSGLIGSALINYIKDQEESFKIFSPSSKDYDLREQLEVRQMFRKIKPNIVIHCAALVGGIWANATMGGKFFYENTIMNTLVFEEARLAKVDRLIAMGSGCMYPARPPVPTKEDCLWYGPPEITNEPYAISKRMLATQSHAYNKQYGFSSAIAILGNQYGPGDNFHLEDGHLIPSLVRKFVEAKQNNTDVTLWGTGNITRDFLYSQDTAMVIYQLIDSEFIGEINVGSGIETSLKEVVDIIVKIIKFEGNIAFNSFKPDGEPRKCLDISLLKETIDFKPAVSLEQGIEQTINWFISNKDKFRSDKK